MSKYRPCPCGSKHLYHKCCKLYHDGSIPENALKLMRSRYSAYAMDLPDYIIATTHRDNPQRQENLESWKNDIQLFSRNTSFDYLEILDFQDGEETAWVTFKANLRQNEADISFAERSFFEKEGDRWFYRSGERQP